MQIRFSPYTPNFQRQKPQLALPKKEMLEKIKTSLGNSKNILGRGGDAEVWKIEGTEYCVRIPHDSFGDIYHNFSTRINNTDRANHTIAKLGNGATIMKVIEGYTYFMKGVKNSRIAKMVEDMPVKAFEDLILQIIKAEENKDVSFDSGPKNIIINPKEETLTATDFCKIEDNPYKHQVFSEVFQCLAGKHLASQEQQRKCAGKILAATLSIVEKHNEINPFDYGLGKFLYSEDLSKLVISPNYIKILENNLKKQDYKIVSVLIKQLFEL